MKKIKNIETIIFDFGGTLDGNGIHWRNRFFDLIVQQIPTLTWDQFEYADRQSIADLIADQATLESNLRKSAEAILIGIDKYLTTVKIDTVLATDQFCQSAESFLKKSRKFLEQLSTTYHLGVISNNFGNTQGWCDEYDLTPFLDTIIDSTVVKVEKPDPKIFHLALAEIGASAETSIYVGDTFSDDVVGSKQAGMHSAWLVGEQEKTCPNPSLVDIFLPQLEALTGFLC